MGWIAHRKWKEIKQQPSTAGPGNMLGCCLLSFYFLEAIHTIRPVHEVRHGDPVPHGVGLGPCWGQGIWSTCSCQPMTWCSQLFWIVFLAVKVPYTRLEIFEWQVSVSAASS